MKAFKAFNFLKCTGWEGLKKNKKRTLIKRSTFIKQLVKHQCPLFCVTCFDGNNNSWYDYSLQKFRKAGGAITKQLCMVNTVLNTMQYCRAEVHLIKHQTKPPFFILEATGGSLWKSVKSNKQSQITSKFQKIFEKYQNERSVSTFSYSSINFVRGTLQLLNILFAKHLKWLLPDVIQFSKRKFLIVCYCSNYP